MYDVRNDETRVPRRIGENERLKLQLDLKTFNAVCRRKR